MLQLWRLWFHHRALLMPLWLSFPKVRVLTLSVQPLFRSNTQSASKSLSFSFIVLSGSFSCIFRDALFLVRLHYCIKRPYCSQDSPTHYISTIISWCSAERLQCALFTQRNSPLSLVPLSLSLSPRSNRSLCSQSLPLKWHSSHVSSNRNC